MKKRSLEKEFKEEFKNLLAKSENFGVRGGNGLVAVLEEANLIGADVHLLHRLAGHPPAGDENGEGG